MDREGSVCKLNNKGLSLVELLVAIAIAAIVAASIAGLMTFAVRQYRNESVNTQMQYELQSNINMIMDEVMASQTMVVDQNGIAIATVGAPYTKYALFGKVTATGFDGVIFVSSSADADHKFKLYMDRFTDASTDPKAVAEAAYTRVSSHFSDDPNPYLLGENVTRFVIEPDPETGTCLMPDPKDATKYLYTNPISVKVELNFEKNGWGDKKYNKHVEEVTYMRNRLSNPVYVGVSDVFKTYTLKKKDE